MATPIFSLDADAHLLVPVDFSNHSRVALQTAAEMIRKAQGGKLTLLTVVEPPTNALRIQTGDLHKLMETEATRHLQEWIRKEVPDLKTVRTAVKFGRPGEEICKQAEKRKASLIVISSHGYTGLKHYMLGSVAEKVVRHAKIPVLVVR